MLESMGISVEFSHHEGAPGQQEITSATPTRSHGGQHHDVPPGHEAGGAGQGVQATFMPKPFSSTGQRHAHPPLPLRGRPERLLRVGLGVQLSKVGRSFIAGLLKHAAEISRSPTSGSTPTSHLGRLGAHGRGRRRGPVYICWGHNNRSALVRVRCTAPARRVRRGSRSVPWTPARTRTWRTPSSSAAGLKGNRGGYELPRAPRRRLGPLRTRTPRDGHRAPPAEPLARP